MKRTAEIVEQVAPKAHFAPVYTKPAGRTEVQTACTEMSPEAKRSQLFKGEKAAGRNPEALEPAEHHPYL